MRERRFEIYTDAASYNNGLRDSSERQYTCSVAILVLDRKIVRIFKSLNEDSTNVHGELFAIFMGLEETMNILRRIDILEPPYNIDVYSDSEWSIKSLTTWLKSWKKNIGPNGVLHSSTGPVKHQDMIKYIDKNYCQNPDIDLNLYHIRGHIDVDNNKSLEKCIKTFKRNNGFLPDFEKLKFIIGMNNICDRCAVKYLKEGLDAYENR